MHIDKRPTDEYLKRLAAIASLASLALGLSGCNVNVSTKTPATGCRAEITDVHHTPGGIEMEYVPALGPDGTVKPRHAPVQQPDIYQLTLKTIDCFPGKDPQQLTIETNEVMFEQATRGGIVQYDPRGWQLAK